MLSVQCTKYDESPLNAVKVNTVPRINIKTPRPDNIIVQTYVCPLDFVQLLLIQRKYQVRAEPPFALGAETIGRIVAIGNNVDPTRYKIGQMVNAGPTDADGNAWSNYGGFSEYVECEGRSAIIYPDDMDPCLFPSPYGYYTGMHALEDRVQIKKGETLLILGASGGVGVAAIELGKLYGVTVIAAASSDEKLQTCKKLGADYLINYEKENLKTRCREITNGKGVDVVYDPVGDKYAEPAVRALAWKGRYVTIGYAGGDIPKIALNLLLLKEASILGSMAAEYIKHEEDTALELRRKFEALVHKGDVFSEPKPISVYKVTEAAKALNLFNQRQVQGKVMLVMPIYEEEYGNVNQRVSEAKL